VSAISAAVHAKVVLFDRGKESYDIKGMFKWRDILFGYLPEPDFTVCTNAKVQTRQICVPANSTQIPSHCLQ
jgi:hypothetical protein